MAQHFEEDFAQLHLEEDFNESEELKLKEKLIYLLNYYHRQGNFFWVQEEILDLIQSKLSNCEIDRRIKPILFALIKLYNKPTIIIGPLVEGLIGEYTGNDFEIYIYDHDDNYINTGRLQRQDVCEDITSHIKEVRSAEPLEFILQRKGPCYVISYDGNGGEPALRYNSI